MKINKKRLWERLQYLGSIGADPKGGVSRFAWTDSYKEACHILIQWMEEAGLETRIDTIGNIYGRLEGKEDIPPILTGSHLDTVPNGGKFDGMAGIISALEVLTSFSENNYIPNRPIEIIAFVNEEASQFLGSHFGSKAICGMLPEDYATNSVDINTGITMREAMIEFNMGLDPNNFPGSYVNKEDYYTFIELHIEQGTNLLHENLPVGIVSTIAGIKQFYITIKGTAAHAGGMAMENRSDAMAAASNIASEVERLAYNTDRSTRGTVGYIKSSPGEHNIIAEEAVVPVDFREDDDETWENIYINLMKFVDEQCQQRGLTYTVESSLNSPPAHCNENLIELFGSCALENEIPYKKLISFSAHDAMQMARLYPMGMIFLRSSNNGVSHCPEEYTTSEDMSLGTTILLDSLKKISKQDIL